MKLTKSLNVLALTALIAFATACGTTRTLDPLGPYGRIDSTRPAVEAGLTLGQQLVQIDQTIVGAKSLIDSFLLWEHNNRAFISNDAVKSFAKRMEVRAPDVLQTATRLRDAYANDPSGGNRTALEAGLGVLDALVLELAVYRPAR